MCNLHAELFYFSGHSLAVVKGEYSRMNVPLQFPSQNDGTRTPYSGAQAEPHNGEAERALLGAILLDPDILPHAGALVQPADFFLERHTLIYHCMRVVAQNG